MKLSDKVILVAAALMLGLFVGAAPQASAQTPPVQGAQANQVAPGTPAAQAGRGGRGGRGGAPAYPQHAQADAETIARGKAIFGANCSFCHGSDARGGEGGPNLTRSQLVLNDEHGELIAPVVQNGRPGTAMPKFDLSLAQITDIAGYIHSISVSSRGSREIPANIVVGDAKAGEAFFNGGGKCSTCHSVTGDLAGIASKADAKTIQNALVSGGGGRGRAGVTGIEVPDTTVTVTLPTGKTVEGKLDHLDDFLVSLTDADGNHLSYARNGELPKVVVHNPLQAHLDMLPKFTDDEIHNLTAYLVTVK